MTKPTHITVLGGGPAGLSIGYYAKKKGIPFTIYEASDCIGGNSTTLRHGDFLYDSGASLLPFIFYNSEKIHESPGYHTRYTE